MRLNSLFSKRHEPALLSWRRGIVQPTNVRALQETDVLIEFQDVYKAFGEKPILQGASFKICRGEAVGIIGASGTGKSTTLRIAAGLLAPDRGQVLILGKPRTGLLSDENEEEHLRVGMVFQVGYRSKSACSLGVCSASSLIQRMQLYLTH